MNNQNKDQVRSQIASANNILVAVSANPTVDELAASIGLTLALNKLDKHATTVFSGQVPSTIEFLQPEQTIETTTDSLRDFIIALDKSKADKLRYKVEDDVVRIFITPYRTSITQDDLNFTQGDFNVDLVIALGVGRREDLDAAITAHGRILHDATVVSISNAEQTSELGSIHWQETQASSLCEMTAVVTAELQQNILDGQMSTAFLTGIVAETDRFKNEKTTPLTLSLSSQLMTAGANQQLIAQKMEPQPIPQVQESVQAPAMDLPYDSSPVNQPAQSTNEPVGFDNPQDPHPVYAHNEDEQADPVNDGSLSIDHNDTEEVVEDIHIDEHGTLKDKPVDEVQAQGEPTPVGEVLNSANPMYRDESAETPSPSDTPVSVPPETVETDEDENGSATDLGNDTGAEEIHNAYLSPDNAKEDSKKDVSESPSLDQPKTETPMMKHEMVIQPPSDSALAASKKVSDKPFDLSEAEATPGLMPQLQPSQPSAPAVTETQPVPMPPIPGPPKPAASAPVPVAPPAEQTLSALEQSVDSPHVPQSTSVPAPPMPDLAALQDKAAKAADSVAPQFPTPQEAMQSSTPMNIHAPEQPAEKTDTDQAPPVPPPMAPQFFDADGKNQNPFLNPN